MNMDHHAQLLLWALFLLLESFVFICIFVCLFDWELNPGPCLTGECFTAELHPQHLGTVAFDANHYKA